MATLYERVMTDRFAALPQAVRQMHEVYCDCEAAGEGAVERGRGMIARLLCQMMGFPPSGRYSLRVAFAKRGGRESWTRSFGRHRFRSVLSDRHGRISESFGPIRFTFDLPADEEGLRMVLRRWSMFGVPLPMLVAPRIYAREWQEDGRFRFSVEVSMPLAGLVIRYSGWLQRL